MADYIQSSILFQSYVHIDAEFEQLQRGSVADVKRYLTAYLEDRSKHFLDPTVSTTLEFKEGSIKAYATVRGTLSACLPPASDFVVAINQLFWFTKRLSDAAVMELSFKTNSYLAAIERTEARPGIIGQTKRVVDELLSLRPADADKDRSKLTKRLKRAREYSVRLLDVVSSQEDIDVLSKEFLKLLKKAPKEIVVPGATIGRLAGEYETVYAEFANWLAEPKKVKAIGEVEA